MTWGRNHDTCQSSGQNFFRWRSSGRTGIKAGSFLSFIRRELCRHRSFRQWKVDVLHCLAGILRPTEGTVFVDDLCLSEMKEKEAAVWRASYVGYVFQKPLLLPFLTVMENILLSAELAGRKDSRTEAERFLSAVGLDQYGSKNPVHLSMGEQQRVSFVRAVIREPRLLLADEPTSSLDREQQCRFLMKLMLQYQKQSGCMLICATHDPAVQASF